MIDSSEAQALRAVADAMRDGADELRVTSQLRDELTEWAHRLEAAADAAAPDVPRLQLIKGGAH